MRKQIGQWQAGWPVLLFLALILISLRDALVLQGTLGHTWDWDISVFPQQIWERLSRDFFVWDNELRGGYYSPYRTGGLFSLFALAFSLLGGEVFSRLFLILPMLLAAMCMFRFAAEALRLSVWWSTVAGAFYMLSPVVYSRILAGHSILLPYALLPLLLLYTFRAMRGQGGGARFSWRDAVAAGMLLGLEGIHSSLMVLALVPVGLLILFALLRLSRRKQVLASAGIMFALLGLINLYWALPMAAGYLSSGTLYHSGSALDAPNQVSTTSVLSQRQNLFTLTTQSLQEAMRQHAGTGYATEFAYPVPDLLSDLWLGVSFLLPLAAFAAVLRRNEPVQVYLTLAISGLLGITLVSGTAVLTGQAIYQWLMTHAFPVWAEFGNTVRAMPLVSLSYSALVPAFAQQMTRRLRLPAQCAWGAFVVLLLLVYVSPFLVGTELVDAKEPLALRAYQPSAADRQVYDALRSESGDFRITFVPPPWMYYPELYDLGYQWMGGLSPHPEFFFPYLNPAAWRSASDFRSDIHDSLAGKLLGLAAVKYVVYPRARFLDPSQGLAPSPAKATPDYTVAARFLDHVLETQKNLVPISSPVTSTILLRNDAYLPRIYAASHSILVDGTSDLLPTIADSTLFDGQPAIFFKAQQDTFAVESISTQVDRLVAVQSGNGAIRTTDSGRTPSYIFTADPLANPAGSFSVSRSQAFTIRVQATQFESSTSQPGDVAQETFDPLDAEQESGWSGNTVYNRYGSSDGKSLRVVAYLDRAAGPEQYVQIDQQIEPLDLASFPNLRITSNVETPTVQAIKVQLGIDLDGDGVADATWGSPVITHAGSRDDNWNAFDMVRQQFPDHPNYHVVSVALRFQKKPLEEWEHADYSARLYTYGVDILGLYSKDNTPGWIWQLAPSIGPLSKTLSRSLPSLDAQRFPILMQYHLDGPATAYVEAMLNVQDRTGTRKSLRVGGWLLEPFSEGTLSLDVRDQLLGGPVGQGWTALGVDLLLHRLRGHSELRPSTLTLGRAGARWLSGSSNQPAVQPPVLMLDGRQVALKEIPSDADHLRYSTPDVLLSEGAHSVSAAYSDADSRYTVESIEIEPSESRSAPAASPAVTFENINPTRFRVHVGNAQAPFFLVFSETYDPGWRATYSPASNTPSSGLRLDLWYQQSALLNWALETQSAREIPAHYLANGYANGWYVEKTGDYDIVVEFTPQRAYEGGWIITLITLAGSAVILLKSRPRSDQAR